MPEELKKEESSEVPAEDKKEELKENDSEIAPTESKDEVNYKEELEKLRKEKENYKQGMLKYKEQLKEKKSEASQKEEVKEDEEEEEDEKILEVKARLESLESNLTKSVFENEVSKMAANDDESELIKYHYENSIKKTGLDKDSIKRDLERCKILANQKKIMEKASELDAFKKLYQPSNSSQGSSVEEQIQKKEKLSEKDRKFLEFMKE